MKTIYRLIPFKKQLYLALKKVWTPSERIFKHLHFKGIFNVTIDPVASFKIHHHGYQIENEIFWKGLTGGWEKTSMSIWIALCKRASTILDIGANTGIYCLAAKATNPAARVYAFEPVSRVYAKLVDNNRLNGFDIACYELAVSNRDGEAVIYDTPEDHTLSVTVNKNMNPPGFEIVPTAVNTIRLSTLIEKNKLQKIDLIKIDVETHEPEVLEGFEPYLGRDKPALLIEVLSDEIGEQIEHRLLGMNYLYFNIDEASGIRRSDAIRKSDHYNYLLCQEETARELGLT